MTTPREVTAAEREAELQLLERVLNMEPPLVLTTASRTEQLQVLETLGDTYMRSGMHHSPSAHSLGDMYLALVSVTLVPLEVPWSDPLDTLRLDDPQVLQHAAALLAALRAAVDGAEPGRWVPEECFRRYTPKAEEALRMLLGR